MSDALDRAVLRTIRSNRRVSVATVVTAVSARQRVPGRLVREAVWDLVARREVDITWDAMLSIAEPTPPHD